MSYTNRKGNLVLSLGDHFILQQNVYNCYGCIEKGAECVVTDHSNDNSNYYGIQQVEEPHLYARGVILHGLTDRSLIITKNAENSEKTQKEENKKHMAAEMLLQMLKSLEK